MSKEIRTNHMPKIEKPPLNDFSIEFEFPTKDRGILMWYDGPLEGHWIRKNGDDYINVFFDAGVSTEAQIQNTKSTYYRELLFKIEPAIFLDYYKGLYSYLELVEKSVDYFVIDYSTDTTLIWSFSLDELNSLYGGGLPYSIERNENDEYDEYFDEKMKPYLLNKIRNNKIDSIISKKGE